MKNTNYIILIYLSCVFFQVGCKKELEKENQAPTCIITNPKTGDSIETGNTVSISVDANDKDGNIEEVRFEIDNVGVSSSKSYPYIYKWNTTDIEVGNHVIKAAAKDNNGNLTSNEINILLTEIEDNSEKPVAAFIASQSAINVGGSINFTDQSSNVPQSWKWNFGDGETSNSKNPTHKYNQAGVFTVSLTVENYYGSDTKVKTNYITVTDDNGGETNSVTDFDGNIYRTVSIGNQIWMAENLKVTHFPNGKIINLITDDSEWANLEDNNLDDAYCYYNNTLIDNYGALYTYSSAIGDNWNQDNLEGQGVCPDGWHLPTDSEWTTLKTFLTDNGYKDIEGKVLKAITGWGDGRGTDVYGFTAVPCGNRISTTGVFYNEKMYCDWWSSTEFSTSHARSRELYFGSSKFYRVAHSKSYGLSVRCIMDN